METLQSLPNIAGRRFGSLTIGYDKIEQIRAEATTLEAVAALVCGAEREALTIPLVQQALTDLQMRASALTDEDRARVAGVDPKQLLALAVDGLRTKDLTPGV